MRTHRGSAFVAALVLLAACSSDVSQGGVTPPNTGPDGGPTAPPSSAPPPVPSSTLPGVWVQPPASAPILFFVDSQGTYDAPLYVVMRMAADGTAEELWRETTPARPELRDASADRDRMLLVRSTPDPATEVWSVTLYERDLATGVETKIITRDQGFGARYVDDGSGDIVVWGGQGADGALKVVDRIRADGTLVANLASIDTAMGVGWVYAVSSGVPVFVVGGTPMTVVGASGGTKAALGNSDRHCNPARMMDAGNVLAVCVEPIGEYVTQLWRVPLDGSAPQQITHIALDPSGVDFGPSDLWTTTDGRQWVQRDGDCGAVWVEELLADGTSRDSTATGLILGVDGTRLITAANGMCEGGATTIAVYDSATDATTIWWNPPADTPGEIEGVNTFQILAVPS